MLREVEVEVRRKVTMLVDYDDENDIEAIIEQVIEDDDPSLDWDAPEIDCITTLREIEEDLISDRAYEERRDARYA